MFTRRTEVDGITIEQWADSWQCSDEIAIAIFERAQREIDEAGSFANEIVASASGRSDAAARHRFENNGSPLAIVACQIWDDPTDSEESAVLSRAKNIAMKNGEIELFWGDKISV